MKNVQLQVHNLDFQDDATLEEIASLESCSFMAEYGLVILTLHVEDGDVQRAVSSIVRTLAEKAQARVARVHPDLVTSSDIANRVGVSREAVRLWANGVRHSFPVQFDTVGADQRVWRWAEVVEWLAEYKRIDMGEDLPSVRELDAIDAELSRLAAPV